VEELKKSVEERGKTDGTPTQQERWVSLLEGSHRIGRVFGGMRDVLVVRTGYPFHGLSEIDYWSGLVRLALLRVVLQMQSLRPRAFLVCALVSSARESSTRGAN